MHAHEHTVARTMMTLVCLLFLSLALADTALELRGCSAEPGSTLRLVKNEVTCIFDIDSNQFAAVAGEQTVEVNVGGTQELDEFVIAVGMFGFTKRPNTTSVLTVTPGTGKHVLSVSFPYARCSVTGPFIVLNAKVGASETEIAFNQAIQCIVMTEQTEPPTSTTEATFAVLGIFTIGAILFLCIMFIYINQSR